MSVAEAQQKVDSQELSSWMAYDRIDPFGESRADLRSAVIASTLANAHRGKGTRAFTVDDFMPKFDAPKEQSPDEIFHRLMVHAEIHNRAFQKAEVPIGQRR